MTNHTYINDNYVYPLTPFLSSAVRKISFRDKTELCWFTENIEITLSINLDYTELNGEILTVILNLQLAKLLTSLEKKIFNRILLLVHHALQVNKTKNYFLVY